MTQSNVIEIDLTGLLHIDMNVNFFVDNISKMIKATVCPSIFNKLTARDVLATSSSCLETYITKLKDLWDNDEDFKLDIIAQLISQSDLSKLCDLKNKMN